MGCREEGRASAGSTRTPSSAAAAAQIANRGLREKVGGRRTRPVRKLHRRRTRRRSLALQIGLFLLYQSILPTVTRHLRLSLRASSAGPCLRDPCVPCRGSSVPVQRGRGGTLLRTHHIVVSTLGQPRHRVHPHSGPVIGQIPISDWHTLPRLIVQDVQHLPVPTSFPMCAFRSSPSHKLKAAHRHPM